MEEKTYKIVFNAKEETGDFEAEVEIDSASYEEAFIRAMKMVESRKIKWRPKTLYISEVDYINIFIVEKDKVET